MVKGARDEEVERLEAAIHDRQFRVEAINKQLLIIKHTVPGPGGPVEHAAGGACAASLDTADHILSPLIPQHAKGIMSLPRVQKHK